MRTLLLSFVLLAPFTTSTAFAQTATLSPNYLSFGSVVVGTTSASKPATLTNTGETTLSNIVIAAFGDFAQTNTCGNSIAAKSNCTISVAFKPTATGLRLGHISLILATGKCQNVL